MLDLTKKWAYAHNPTERVLVTQYNDDTLTSTYIGIKRYHELDGRAADNRYDLVHLIEAKDTNCPREYSHYFKDVSMLSSIDIYRVLLLWEVSDPCLQHAIKKLFCAGKRGAKDQAKDINEAIASLRRWQEMREEENQNAKP